MRSILIYNIRYDLQQENLDELYSTFFLRADSESNAYPLSVIEYKYSGTMNAEVLEQLLSDHITNTTGWCHKGFDYAFVNAVSEEPT